MERVVFSFKAHGHPNITAVHKSTFELTVDKDLTPRGDCIIGVKSEYSAYTLPDSVKNLLRDDRSIIIISLEAAGFKDRICAYGSKNFTLQSETSIVIRKSGFIDDRTIGIFSNKAARDINRDLISYLKREDAVLKITINIFKLW